MSALLCALLLCLALPAVAGATSVPVTFVFSGDMHGSLLPCRH
jgi:hypothetical protein